MTDDDKANAIGKLAALFGMTQRDDAAGVASAQALLANQKASESMERQAKINEAVQKAHWAAKCSEFEPPEDDVSSNFINCSIVSDEAIGAFAQMVGANTGDANKPEHPHIPEHPHHHPKPWWRWFLRALLLLGAVVLGAILIWLTLQWFGGDDSSYEIIALPYNPGTLANG